MQDDSLALQAENPLAPVLTDQTRELREVKIELLAERLMRACLADFCHWLEGELGRARAWSLVEITVRWRAELARRERAAATARGKDGIA